MTGKIFWVALIGTVMMHTTPLFAQITERERPEQWNQLAAGGRFMDRFLPMQGKLLSSDTWGVDGVLPRYVDNGIEDRIWSYWGGNIIRGEDSLYHLMVCGWLESSPKGHGEWSNSIVFNTVSDNPTGPFRLRNVIGKGHNPEVFRLDDGRYVLYVIDGRYITDDINGNWEYGKFDFNPRDRRILAGLSNLSFARREDGSYLMVCRGGGMWISRDGISEYAQITDKSVYPAVAGKFEDPVIWRDHVQYHMIVNDWLGRIAYYLRSKDGITWVTDPGEAYMPGISVHQDGTVEDWFKYERIKMYQDDYGRAVQANFAVIDTLKPLDKPFDIHSSKNIGIPLNPGVLLTVLDENPITTRTRTIRLKIHAEAGFDPHTDIDLSSLRFGASGEVDYGRGCEVLTSQPDGPDLIVTFDARGHGITGEEFAPKLLGRYTDGKLLFGYARLPYVDYLEPILSARAPVFSKQSKGWSGTIEVVNFGPTDSRKCSLKIEYIENGSPVKITDIPVPVLSPYQKTVLDFTGNHPWNPEQEYHLRVTINSGKRTLSTFDLKKKIFGSNAEGN